MAGGRSGVKDELLYRFEFPERPDELKRSLKPPFPLNFPPSSFCLVFTFSVFPSTALLSSASNVTNCSVLLTYLHSARFLECLNSEWSVTLWHYRYSGGVTGSVLVGMQVPAETRKEFQVSSRMLP
jgi:hypothetical protein